MGIRYYKPVTAGRRGASVSDFAEITDLPSMLGDGPLVGFFPGSTIGNFPPDEAVALLVRVRRLLGEGAIGRVIAARIHTGSYLPEWRPGTDYRRSYSASSTRGGGAILDCIHEIDLALWYFGPGVLSASATVPAHTLGLEVEGLAEILIRHDSGVLSSVHLNFIQRDYQRECRIIGTAGTLSWTFQEPYVRCEGPPETARRAGLCPS